MTACAYDVAALGNAIVDTLAFVPDDFIAQQGMMRGSMQLIDAARAAQLTALLPERHDVSGGSAANTAAGVASFGGRAVFAGKVAEDEAGRLFRDKIEAAGIVFSPVSGPTDEPTARSIVCVTPDRQRTMNTHLGASTAVTEAGLDPAPFAQAQFTFVEAYLFQPASARAALMKAAGACRGAGRKLALSLAADWLAGSEQATVRELCQAGVEVLFANAAEALAFTGAARLEDAARAMVPLARIVCLTQSEHGSLVLADGVGYPIPVVPYGGVVDTTGAGDLYAAGVLTGLARGLPPAAAGLLGALAAAEVIAHLGARPAVGLKALAAERLGIAL